MSQLLGMSVPVGIISMHDGTVEAASRLPVEIRATGVDGSV